MGGDGRNRIRGLVERDHGRVDATAHDVAIDTEITSPSGGSDGNLGGTRQQSSRWPGRSRPPLAIRGATVRRLIEGGDRAAPHAATTRRPMGSLGSRCFYAYERGVHQP